MSNSSSSKQRSDQKQSNKLGHYMKAPFRALVRARDMYVRGLGGCAGRVERGRVISSAAAVPRSRSHGFYQSRNSSVRNDDDINDLIRATSQGRLGMLNSKKDVTVVPRSQSVAVGVGVGIGRIDEDKPCDFGEQLPQKVVYPRSRSYAVGVGVMEKRRKVPRIEL